MSNVHLAGKADDIRFFGRSLTPEEHLAWYTAGRGNPASI
jgi:hypothetical protein